MNEIFRLDEQAAADDCNGLGTFAERYPAEDEHSAMLAIDSAIYPADDEDAVILAADGWGVTVDLSADGNGTIDGWRILIQPPGWPWPCQMAGSVNHVSRAWSPEEGEGEADPLDILRDAVDEANRLAAFVLSLRITKTGDSNE